MSDKYEPLEFSSLVGIDPATVSDADLEAAQAKLAEIKAEASAAQAGWPFDAAAYPAPVMAVLDSLVVWRQAWLAYQEAPGEDKASRAAARDALAAADVADDNLADLVDSLLDWRQAEYPRYARAQARRAADREAMAPKDETPSAAPVRKPRRRRDSETPRQIDG